MMVGSRATTVVAALVIALSATAGSASAPRGDRPGAKPSVLAKGDRLSPAKRTDLAAVARVELSPTPAGPELIMRDAASRVVFRSSDAAAASWAAKGADLPPIPDGLALNEASGQTRGAPALGCETAVSPLSGAGTVAPARCLS